MSDQPSASPRSPLTEDEQLLIPPQVVPVERRASFTSTDPWRVLRIMGEFVEGFDTMSDVRNAVTIFGSARTPETSPEYAAANDSSSLIACRNKSALSLTVLPLRLSLSCPSR